MMEVKNDITVIKRNGVEEKFNVNKLKKILYWASDNKEPFVNNILSSFNLKLKDRIKTSDIQDELIRTSLNLINPLYSFYDEIAEKLFVIKMYKEVAGLKVTGVYPTLQSFISKGIKYKIYNPNVLNKFSEADLNYLNSCIVPDRDFIFTSQGIILMASKYCKKLKRKQFELPQITYMVAAMYSFYNDYNLGSKEKMIKAKNKRLEYIKDAYDNLSLQKVTYATPRILNSLTNYPQLASCVLTTMGDNIESLNDTDSNIALYSKFSGGIGCDFSAVRSMGSHISSNNGRSDGPIPFIKRLEQTVSSFNQQGTRKGSAVVTFSWWHLDVLDLLKLKDAGGTEELRARKLQYAMKISNILKKRMETDDFITLFDPRDVPLLNKTFGEIFDRNYIMYENKSNIRKKKIKAKDLIFEFLKIRTETGNLYATFIDNINEQNMRNEFVGSSNLCQEITIPSSPSKYFDNVISCDFNYKFKIQQTKESGEIGICNLLSINLMYWVGLSNKEKYTFMYNTLRACDNIIDTQFYPVKEGEIANKKNRPIGIGVTNYACLLASNKLKYTDKQTKQFTFDVFEDLYYWVYHCSNRLAKERGAYLTFRNDKWADGITPIHLSKFDYTKFGLEFKNKCRWDKLSSDIKKYGVRFSYHAAIAPTATSGKVASATESIEPIVDIFSISEGVYSLPFLVPNLKSCRSYYQRCWEIPARTIIELAAIRQFFIDQSQSLNLYYIKPESAKELWNDIQYAMDLGIKTLYYMKTPKSNFELEEICESCT